MNMMAAMTGGGKPDPLIVLPDSALGTVARVNGIPCWATWKLDSDKNVYRGVIQSNDFVTYFTEYGAGVAWLDSGGTASDYDARMTATFGALEGDASATWLNLGTDREWKMADYSADGAGYVGTALLEIRNTSTQRIVKVATVSFDVWRLG